VSRAVKVCIVTAGHLSTCPRMLKAADALHEDGYQVRVVSVNHTAWATAADRDVMATRGWAWTAVDYSRATARVMQVMTGARLRAALAVSRWVGPAHVPLAVAARACSRAHPELVRAVAAQPAGFLYGGSTGALKAVAEAAARLRVPYALDLEDFHSAEEEGPSGLLDGALMERIESRVLPGATFLTAASPMIGQGYADKYGVRPITIYNTFSLEPGVPAPETAAGPLRIYWFSQTLGPTRGIEPFVRAFGLAGVTGELHLRARIIPSYFETLQRLQRETAPGLTIVASEPAAPADMVRLARGYDAGLSGEEAPVLNRAWCLGNKIFTYLAAGVPVIFSHTPAQAALARELGDAAFIYDSVEDLAQILRDLAADPARRCRARRAARAAAEQRWHWEHAADRGALLDAFHKAVA